MRSAAFFLCLTVAATACAEREVPLGMFADEVRGRVVCKIDEALKASEKVEVSGVVTFAGRGVFFLQRDTDGLKIFSSGRLPSAGDQLVVSGSPSLEGGRIVFVAKNWTKTGCEALPAARLVSREEMVEEGREGGSVHALRVTVEGRAIGVTENGFAISVDGLPVNVMVEVPPDFIADCGQTHPKVRVTGVAELMLDQSVLLGREGYVMGVKIEVQNPSDVELLPDLSYLAARRDRMLVRAFVAVMVLLVVGLTIFTYVVFRQRRGLFRTQTIMAERKRMADDIHDTIEQHLVGAGMLLKVNRLKEAEDVLVRAKREIRDIVWGLKNDDMMRLTPAEMLRQLAHEENVKGLYRVDTRLEGLPAKMDAAQMRDLSLIVRETIGNAVKHGGAKHIAISSDPLPGGGWLLRVSNDGAPFDPGSAPGAKDGHFGIEGMRQRARRLGATVSIEPRGKGMVMILEKRM